MNKVKKVKLSKIAIKEPQKDKRGKEYMRVGIQFEGGAEKWYGKLSYSEHDSERKWQVGDVVYIKLEQNGQYLNFRHPSKSDLFSIIFDLDERLTALEDAPQPDIHNDMPL